MSDNQPMNNNSPTPPRRRPSRTVISAPPKSGNDAERTEQNAATYRVHVNNQVSPVNTPHVDTSPVYAPPAYTPHVDTPPVNAPDNAETINISRVDGQFQTQKRANPPSRVEMSAPADKQGQTPYSQTQTQRPNAPSIENVSYSVGKRGKSVKRHTTSGIPPASNVGGKSSYREYQTGDSAGKSMLSSVMKAVAYIVFLLVTVTFLSYYAISCGNDCFAFVKSSEEITVSIPEYATISDIAKILGDNDVINYPTIFKIYAKLRKKADVEFVSGEYTVSPSMSYDTLIREFRNVENSDYAEISITFSEGMTLNQMIDLFVENGIGTRDGFLNEVKTGDFSNFWFIKELEDNGMNPNRTYRLEGYLYPDTYRFYKSSTEYQALYKMLDNFNTKFAEEYKQSCEVLGMSVDEVVTLASMIEAEAKYVTEFSTISSVFHNRLDNPGYETVGLLQSDATIQYFLDARKAELSSSDLANQNPYNTYVYKGLPPGPICNPTLNAIDAALYPEDTDYFYFVAQTNGYSLFAATSAEHEQNKKIARGEG